MSNHVFKSIKKIVEDNNSKRLVVFTNHLKIDGEFIIPEAHCDECIEDYIALANVEICKLDDYCTCDDENCECNDNICCNFDWLNINVKEIVAFSVIK
ncbi:hypothetical protein KBA27_04100 [bacterium]|nr:hypothetical protein [bacterium]